MDKLMFGLGIRHVGEKVSKVVASNFTNMLEMFKELYEGSKDLWHNDRKEFFEMYGSFALVVFWFAVTWFVLLPIAEGL